ncbi:hypothetical protein Lser_V15G03486 [Lactuca serriola]
MSSSSSSSSASQNQEFHIENPWKCGLPSRLRTSQTDDNPEESSKCALTPWSGR